jgi:hypothetical protein
MSPVDLAVWDDYMSSVTTHMLMVRDGQVLRHNWWKAAAKEYVAGLDFDFAPRMYRLLSDGNFPEGPVDKTLAVLSKQMDVGLGVMQWMTPEDRAIWDRYADQIISTTERLVAGRWQLDELNGQLDIIEGLAHLAESLGVPGPYDDDDANEEAVVEYRGKHVRD